MTGHDQLFKDLLEEFLPDLLHIVVPEIADLLVLDDPRAIRFLKGEHFTDLPKGKRRQVDLLAQVPLREGSEELVLVHVEIERRASSAMGRRLARYAMALELRHARPVIPIVIYIKGGPPGIRRQVYSRRVSKQELLRFTYWQLSLASTSAESFLRRDEPLAWALAAVMQAGHLAPVQHCLECLTRIGDHGKHLNAAQRYLLVNCVGTYVQLDQEQEEDLMATLEEHGRRDILEIYDSGITWADRKREQALARAREEGLAQGMEEGLERGMERVLLRQMERRFGELPEAVRLKVQALDSEALEDLADRLLTATSLDDLKLPA